MLAIGVALGAVASGAIAPRAHAIDPTIRSIIVGGMYGIVAGTALGLISYPMTGSVRGIFMGSSIGLYLGMVVGGYYVANKDDPYNPLRRQSVRSGGDIVTDREDGIPGFWITAAPAPAGAGPQGVQLGVRIAAF